jgi:ferric-dicitrate binding protein FerR (iron transport regulator)
MANSVVQRSRTHIDTATEWFARLRASDVTGRDRVRFVEWFADMENRAAFDEVLSLWERLRCVTALDAPVMRHRDKA